MHKVCVFEQLIKTEWRNEKNKDQHDLTATLIDLLKKVRGRIALNCIEIAQGSELLCVYIFFYRLVFFLH